MYEQGKGEEEAVAEASTNPQNTSTVSQPLKNVPDVGAADFDGYISVSASEDGNNLLEIPVNDDGSLSMATLSHSFPEAIGLKFRNPSSGIFRTLAVDEQKRCIYPPKGGWGTRRYIAIFAIPSGDRKRPRNDDMGDLVGEKRSGLDDSLNESLRVPIDLIVLNLSFKTDEDALKKFFEQYGEVQYVEVKRDFKTNMPKGYGFVKFANIEAQNKVLEEKEVYIDGRVAQVKVPNHIPNKYSVPEMMPMQETISTKLYVGRVWNTLTEKDIFDVLDAEAKKISDKAKVERVFIPKPHRGFAFVTLNDANVTKRFCQMRDFIIRGKSVCVSIPTPKNTATYQMQPLPMQNQMQPQQPMQNQMQPQQSLQNQMQSQPQQPVQNQDMYSSQQYQMPQQQGPVQPFSPPINYSSNQPPPQQIPPQQFPPQQQNWMNQRSAYRGTRAHVVNQQWN